MREFIDMVWAYYNKNENKWFRGSKFIMEINVEEIKWYENGWNDWMRGRT